MQRRCFWVSWHEGSGRELYDAVLLLFSHASDHVQDPSATVQDEDNVGLRSEDAGSFEASGFHYGLLTMACTRQSWITSDHNL